MFTNQSTDITIPGPCRAMDAVHGNKIENRFILGTCSTNSNSTIINTTTTSLQQQQQHRTNGDHNNNNNMNHLYVVQFDNEINELSIIQSYEHYTGSVGYIRCHPTDPSLLVTAPERGNAVTIWKLPTTSTNNNNNNNRNSGSGGPEEDEEYDNDHDDYYGQTRRNNTSSSHWNNNDDSYNSSTNRYNTTTTGGNTSNTNTEGFMERIATLQYPDDKNECYAITCIDWKDDANHRTTTSPTSYNNNNEDDDDDNDNENIHDDDDFDADDAENGAAVFVTIDTGGNLIQWDLSLGGGGISDPIRYVSLQQKETDQKVGGSVVVPPPRVQLDPHSNGGDIILAASYGTNVHLLDWRMDPSVPMGTVDTLRNCHRYGVTDLHYNPNKPYVLVTSGKDGCMKFWDLRSTRQQPLLTTKGGHSHYITNVLYNPCHDQLVLSTGTDSYVNLWRLSTISSAPLLTYDDENHNNHNHNNNNNNNHSFQQHNNNNNNNSMNGGGTGVEEYNTNQKKNISVSSSSSSSPNARVSCHEHNDAVYAAAWGAADAWIYVTVGYDGKAILNHVPSQEKYKILL